MHPGVSPDKEEEEGEDWVADVEKLLFNFVLEGDVISPQISLYQTIFDDIGLPTGQYKQVGIYTSYNTFLIEYDIPVPYDAFHNLDLFLIVQGIGVDVGVYTVDFWITGAKEG